LRLLWSLAYSEHCYVGARGCYLSHADGPGDAL
jgi:hypothetical protein